MTDKDLIKQAFEAAEFAYSPYSNYKVGAALLCQNGKVFKGCNIENSTYSPTNCAERTAFFKAISEGERNFEAIAIVGYKENQEERIFFYPCGVCRQVMIEFCDEKDFKIIVAKTEDDFEIMTLSQLMPKIIKPK